MAAGEYPLVSMPGATTTDPQDGQDGTWALLAAVVGAGVLTSLIGELAWGGWARSFLFLGLVPLLGLLLSARSFLSGRTRHSERAP